MTEDESLKEIVVQAFRKSFQRNKKLWIGFMRHQFLTILMTYGFVCILLTFGYIGLEQYFGANLNLKPQLTPEGEGSFFPFAVLLLPLTLFLETLGIRYMPWVMIHIYRLHTIEVEVIEGEWQIADKRRWRVWLYRHHRLFFIVVCALWHGLLHQLNVYSANFLGNVAFFGVQTVIGLMLAWIYIHKGFWQSYTIQLSWDMILIAFSLVLPFLSSI